MRRWRQQGRLRRATVRLTICSGTRASAARVSWRPSFSLCLYIFFLSFCPYSFLQSSSLPTDDDRKDQRSPGPVPQSVPSLGRTAKAEGGDHTPAAMRKDGSMDCDGCIRPTWIRWTTVLLHPVHRASLSPPPHFHLTTHATQSFLFFGGPSSSRRK